ncbi:MAG TPA: ComF family protein [Stellaceae bacterium]|nr:ComF family protein [Stellaceae bacterium]
MVFLAARPARWLRRSAAGLVDLLLPPRCLACGTAIGREGELCPACWRGIVFLGAPLCACCGLPFPYEAGAEALCGACIADPPAYDRARAVFRYDERSRGLVLALKHGDRTHGAPAFGRWMRRAGAELLAEADLMMPVPLHWTRLFARRYNQAGLLAHAIRAAGGPPVAADWLRRRRRTPSQGHRNRTARADNVRGAFTLRQGRSVAGARIVLVDDVFTTGATVAECARVLRRAGARRIDVLTLARVVRGGAE